MIQEISVQFGNNRLVLIEIYFNSMTFYIFIWVLYVIYRYKKYLNIYFKFWFRNKEREFIFFYGSLC